MNLHYWQLYFAGFIEPGPSGAMSYGWAICNTSTGELVSDGGMVGTSPTNSLELAAYCGLYRGLERLGEMRQASAKYPGVRIRSDCKAVITALLQPWNRSRLPEREHNAYSKCAGLMVGVQPVEFEVIATGINGLAWLEIERARAGKRKAVRV